MIRTLVPVAALVVLSVPADGQLAGPRVHRISVQAVSFTPNDLTVNLGDTVRWQWVAGVHNVESGVGGVHDGNFRSGDLVGAPQQFSVTFDAAFLAANPMPGNDYPYYCVAHVGVGMFGRVSVNGVPAVFAAYGCGVNPAGSLVRSSGMPGIGQSFTIAIDNPAGTQPPGSLALVAVSVAPDAAYPCGSLVPGFGMGAPGQAGELLVSLAPQDLVAVLGPKTWSGAGSPASFLVPVPPDPTLAGVDMYLQGVIADPTFTSGIPLALTGGGRATIGS